MLLDMFLGERSLLTSSKLKAKPVVRSELGTLVYLLAEELIPI